MKPIESVIRAANTLGCLAEHPSLAQPQAAAAREIWEKAETSKLISEHAALVAVAEAAQFQYERMEEGTNTEGSFDELGKSLANLAAVRAGKDNTHES